MTRARVLFVCHGNICRSTMAHQVFTEAVRDAGLEGLVEVDSAGISNEEEGHSIDYRAARVLRENGYEVPDHRARQIQAGELSQWDVILAATRSQQAALERLKARVGLGAQDAPEIKLMRDFDPEAAQGVHSHLDLPDPWYGGYSDFVDTLSVIERCTPTLLRYVRNDFLKREN